MDWLKAINNYLKSSFKSPFFLFTGDADYSCVIQELNDFGLDKKRLSDLCPQDDKIPDIDVLFNEMAIADVNADQKSFFLIGIGELLGIHVPEASGGGIGFHLAVLGMASEIAFHQRIQRDFGDQPLWNLPAVA